MTGHDIDRLPRAVTAMKTVILDRDGVINEDSDAFIKSVAEWRPIPGSLEAIARLSRHGYRVVVATNQSGVARGLLSIDTLNAIHQHMVEQVRAHGGSIEAIFFCPHGPDDDCTCRKPRNGLFREIERRLMIETNGIPAVGDSLRDLVAAAASGALPVLVRTGKGRQTVKALRAADSPLDPARIPVYDNLAAFADALLSGELDHAIRESVDA